jgi:asparaginyl-tRNA synthetase
MSTEITASKSKTIPEILEDETLIGQKIQVEGYAKRVQIGGKGTLLFVHVGDSSTLKTLQCVFKITEDFDQEVTFESSVRVTGTLIESPARGQKVEVQADTVEVIGTCDVDEYPLHKKKKGYHPLEFLRQHIHLRPRDATHAAIMRIRHWLAMATMRFYHSEGFYWIHTPIITTSDCEGGGEAFEMGVKGVPDFFGKKTVVGADGTESQEPIQAYATVSGQLHVEPYALAMRKAFVFGPSFRGEKSKTSRHASEFWMLEPEAAFMDLDGMIKLSEKYFKFVIKECLEQCREDIEFLAKRFKLEGHVEKLEKDISEDFARITYEQAIDLLQESGRKFQKPSEWGVDLGADQEMYICEEVFGKPTYVTDYPAEIKAFYMYLSDDQKTVACTDCFFPGIGEVLGGSQREHRPEILEDKMAAAGLDYQWYKDTRKYGTVPHSGFGVGFDRLLRYISGIDHIMDVIPYPVRYESISS